MNSELLNVNERLHMGTADGKCVERLREVCGELSLDICLIKNMDYNYICFDSMLYINTDLPDRNIIELITFLMQHVMQQSKKTQKISLNFN